MRQVRATGLCTAPFTSCVEVAQVSAPTPARGEALIAVNGTSVNPSDCDTVEMGGCAKGCGADVAGTVVECPGCTRLKPGDVVWTLAQPAYADYVVAQESMVGLAPKLTAGFDIAAAGTLPEVGLTSLFSLKRTVAAPGTPMPSGSPWSPAKYGHNLTVAVTAGSSGTGAVAIELAKAFGAAHVATATTGAAGAAFVKKLGADIVVDYMEQEILDALPEASVDIVYDNYGAEGSADKAMRVLREGGAYLLLPHGECYETQSQAPPCLSANPKPGVSQLNYATGVDFEAHALAGLDELKALVQSGGLHAHVGRTFSLTHAAAAFNFSAGGGSGGVDDHLGKISIVTAEFA